MNKILILTIVLIALSVNLSYSQEENISAAGGMKFFDGTWSQVLAAAKEQNKYIFVDAFADWCVPCKWMVANVFPTEAAGSFYNEKFIMYKYDMEKGEGVDFAKKYNVNLYPTYLYFNPDGELVHRSTGSKPLESFIEDGKNALDPDKQSNSMNIRYEKGDRSPDFLYEYAFSQAAADPNSPKTAEVTNAYLATQKDEDLVNEKNWKIISQLLFDVNSHAFKYFEENKSKFAEKYGEKDVDMKYAYTKLQYLNMSKQWDEYAKIAAPFVDKYAMDNWEMLNEFAWAIYENVNDKDMLTRAENWAKKSTELDKNFYNCDTYASLLFKLGKYKKALKYANDAIELAKKSSQDYKGTEELKKKIEKKLDE